MKEIWKKAMKIKNKIAEDHVSAYAAQSAFFMMLSLVPIILLLMTLIQYTPITQSDILIAVNELFPKTIRMSMIAIVDEVYNQTGTTISVTLIVAFWSAGKGVLAMSRGLNAIKGLRETRNYFFLRIRAAFYTVLFIVVIILSLVILGFGNSISILVNEYIVDFIIEIRTVIAICVLSVFSVCIYCFLPNKREDWRKQFPGAIFTVFGWTFASFLVSIYVDVFKGFSNMYGSLTAIVLIMFWLYFCMYVMLLGGEINDLLMEHLDNTRESV